MQGVREIGGSIYSQKKKTLIFFGFWRRKKRRRKRRLGLFECEGMKIKERTYLLLLLVLVPGLHKRWFLVPVSTTMASCVGLFYLSQLSTGEPVGDNARYVLCLKLTKAESVTL